MVKMRPSTEVGKIALLKHTHTHTHMDTHTYLSIISIKIATLNQKVVNICPVEAAVLEVYSEAIAAAHLGDNDGGL